MSASAAAQAVASTAQLTAKELTAFLEYQDAAPAAGYRGVSKDHVLSMLIRCATGDRKRLHADLDAWHGASLELEVDSWKPANKEANARNNMLR